MNDIQENKLQRFINDEIMADAVYQVLLGSFLAERKGADVNVLASCMISVTNLKDAWKEIERYKESTDDDSVKQNNVGM